MQRLKDARVNAGKILNRYPDYAKATPGYTGAIIEAMAGFDADTQAAMTHPTEGVCGKCKFLPTVADLVEFGAERDRILKPAPRPAHYKPSVPALEHHISPEARSRAVASAKAMIEEFRQKEKPEQQPTRVYTREELLASRDRLLKYMARDVA